jgi:long-chain acyl-CoA synthetase
MSNLGTNLSAAAAKWRDNVALRCDGTAVTFAEFDDKAARVATLLAQAGVQPGDRVGLMMPNTVAFAVAFYGIMYRGAVAVPMNPLLKEREVEFYLANTDAAALFADSTSAQAAHDGAVSAGTRHRWILDDGGLDELIAGLPRPAEMESRADEDDAVILHTSGTTGRPKGARLTHAGLHRNAELTARTLICIDHNDAVIGCLPLFHVFGLTCGLNAALLAGATLSLLPRFEPSKALEVIERDAITVFEGVPTMYSALLQATSLTSRAAARTLRTCISGGTALPVQVINDFEEAFGCMILEGYGLSETSPVAAFNHPGKPRKPGSIGTPVEGVEMRIIDAQRDDAVSGEVGEIQIRGHNVMAGYWNQRDATAATINAEGWLSTGDIGRVDEDGYYYIVDRAKDMIIRGGYNVYPREIEEVLYEHPAVAEAAVIGIPHDTLGEEVAAAVSLRGGASVQAADLREFVRARVAAYKYPRRIWFVDTLPKGATGKIVKRGIAIPAAETIT